MDLLQTGHLAGNGHWIVSTNFSGAFKIEQMSKEKILYEE